MNVDRHCKGSRNRVTHECDKGVTEGKTIASNRGPNANRLDNESPRNSPDTRPRDDGTIVLQRSTAIVRQTARPRRRPPTLRFLSRIPGTTDDDDETTIRRTATTIYRATASDAVTVVFFLFGFFIFPPAITFRLPTACSRGVASVIPVSTPYGAAPRTLHGSLHAETRPHFHRTRTELARARAWTTRTTKHAKPPPRRAILVV